MRKAQMRSCRKVVSLSLLSLISADRFNLQRFADAQAGGVYEQALSEIKAGEKRSHWMWFIFPQSADLGQPGGEILRAVRRGRGASVKTLSRRNFGASTDCAHGCCIVCARGDPR